MDHHSLRIAIIADDLTGAMDAAVPFACRGLRVVVVTDPEKIAAPHSQTDVLSISTNSRHCSEAEAVALVLQAYAKLDTLGPEVLIKKIDSTLRGHAAAESCALYEASDRREGVICPAVPSQGRAVIHGNLVVNGVPLADTSFSRDLRSKPPVEPMQQLFSKYVDNVPVRLEEQRRHHPTADSLLEPCLSICDAAEDTDILALVKDRVHRLDDTLFIGASGLTIGLAQQLFGDPHAGPLTEPPGSRALFVIGSVTPETKAQVDELQQRGVDLKVVELEGCSAISNSSIDELHTREEESCVILVKAPTFSKEALYSSAQVVNALAESASSITANCDIDLIVASGGDTVQGVLERLKCDEIVVQGEVEPGVVHGMLETDGKRLRLVTKAGGFGKRDLFLKILHFFNS